VFQYGVGAGILGFQETDTIEAWVPLFLFSVLFRMCPNAIGATKRRRFGFLSGLPTRSNPTRDRPRVAVRLPAAA